MGGVSLVACLNKPRCNPWKSETNGGIILCTKLTGALAVALVLVDSLSSLWCVTLWRIPGVCTITVAGTGAEAAAVVDAVAKTVAAEDGITVTMIGR